MFCFISVTHVFFKLLSARSKLVVYNLQFLHYSLFRKIPNSYPYIIAGTYWLSRCHQTKRKKIFVCIYDTITYFRSITIHNLSAQMYVLLVFLSHISVR
jgi:hypothetical protein